MSSAGFDWVLKTDVAGFSRHFASEALPVSIGAGAGADIRLAGCVGSLSVGVLDDVFFVQPERGARGLRVGGEEVAGARRLADGDLIEFGSAKMACRIDGGRLTLDIDARITAGDTAPPDLEELAREARADEEVAITPVSFRTAQAEAATPTTRRRLNVGALVAVCTFAALAVLAWFAFTAKSVELRIEPAPATVDLPDTLMKLRLGDRYLLRRGQHRIVATLPGYYPLDMPIEVGESADQTFPLELTRLPGTIEFATAPEVNAEVSVAGEPLGHTPLTAELPPGEYVFEVTAPRYLAARQALEVEGGGTHQALSVPMVPNWAPVEITSTPPGATVSVDGEPVGATPAVLEVEAGTHDIEVRLAGYNAWRDQIEVAANVPQSLPAVELREADGRVEIVSTPNEASVSVDGAFQGRTPLTLTLRPGRAHRLQLSKPGYDTTTRELSVAADSGRRLEIELAAQFGQVEIVSEPPQAEVWIDGRREAATPATLSLTAVPHRIEVRLDGFAVPEETITPRPGFTQALSFDLVPLDNTTGDGYPRTVTTGLGQELRLVPAGQFTMGSSRRDPDRRSNEELRRVKLSKAFYLGTHEVTNAEFRAFKAGHDSGRFQGEPLDGEDQPVVGVSFDEVAQFLNWLSVRDGLQPVYEEVDGRFRAVRPLRSGYRLPTEAEWAWAARFAEREEPLHFSWGAELPPPDRSGNFADVSAADVLRPTLVTYSDGFVTTAPVGRFAADALGFFDLGGNAAEWVQDFYEPAYTNPTEQVEDPLGPESGRFHVVRGSSWRSATATQLRLAYRDYSDGPRDDLGFRIARNLE